MSLPSSRAPQPTLAGAISAGLFLVSLVWGASTSATAGWWHESLGLVLLATSLVSQRLEILFASQQTISGWDWCYLLAIFFLDAPSAMAIVVITVTLTFVVDPYRRVSLLNNLTSLTLPILVGSALFGTFAGPDPQDTSFILAAAATTVVTLSLHLVMGGALISLQDGVSVEEMTRRVRPMTVTLAFQAAFAVCIAALYARFGLEVMASAIVLIAGFAYMAHLVVQARERSRRYANWSGGILSGLIRTLDARDKRAARHCAAVARFSRDIASATGMSERDQEIAHTAGLLHDIGRFALSDRVMDGSTELTDEDWRQIRRHPSIGAELLADVDFYGPVAAIIAAHHERMDGRGYPARMRGADIPPIARIVAVAEVYDTLTAPDTYRTPMTSFEALNELRRVAGRQLDALYVEALAGLLAGQGTAYRHAGEADFDVELDIERRANEAAAT